MACTGILIGGPQDGGYIRFSKGEFYPVVYVGPKWLGDGFVAYSHVEPNKRFPCMYAHEGKGCYRFHGWRPVAE